MQPQWKQHQTLLYIDANLDPNKKKILGLDLDGTLIKTKSGRKFPKDAYDWQWFSENIPQFLLNHCGEYQCIIFTNQGGIKNKQDKMTTFITKMNLIFQTLGYVIPTYASTDHGPYRKPSPYLFGAAIGQSKPESFTYVGDAAGRPGNHADTDYKFAINVQGYYGIPSFFNTPETLFLNNPSQPVLSGFDPATYVNPHQTQLTKLPSQEMMVLVGRPASGKSRIAEIYGQEGYQIVSKDVSKTLEKTLSIAEAAIAQGKSVIVDNTNPSQNDRSRYIQLAKKYNLPVRAIYLDVPRELNDHLHVIRTILGQKEHIPEIAYRNYNSNFQMPSLAEGFNDVITIGFTYDPNINSEFTKLYNLRY